MPTSLRDGYRTTMTMMTRYVAVSCSVLQCLAHAVHICMYVYIHTHTETHTHTCTHTCTHAHKNTLRICMYGYIYVCKSTLQHKITTCGNVFASSDFCCIRAHLQVWMYTYMHMCIYFLYWNSQDSNILYTSQPVWNKNFSIRYSHTYQSLWSKGFEGRSSRGLSVPNPECFHFHGWMYTDE